MSIQDFFSCVYNSHRQQLDRIATLVVIETIKDNVISGKELETGQFIEKGRNDLIKTEAEFLKIRSELFSNFAIDVEKFLDRPNPVDEALNQLKIYATKKGFIYEQTCMLAESFGLFVQVQSQIQQDVISPTANEITSAKSLLISRIQSLLPILAGNNDESLISEFMSIVSASNTSVRQYEFFVDKVCSSLDYKASIASSKKIGTSQIHISGNVSGSTIIIGNENEVQNSTNGE